jgi:hypothetical protein
MSQQLKQTANMKFVKPRIESTFNQGLTKFDLTFDEVEKNDPELSRLWKNARLNGCVYHSGHIVRETPICLFDVSYGTIELFLSSSRLCVTPNVEETWPKISPMFPAMEKINNHFRKMQPGENTGLILDKRKRKLYQHCKMHLPEDVTKETCRLLVPYFLTKTSNLIMKTRWTNKQQ